MSDPPPPKLPLSALAVLLSQRIKPTGNALMSPLAEALRDRKATNLPPITGSGSNPFAQPTPTPSALASLFGPADPPKFGNSLGALMAGGFPKTTGGMFAGVTPAKARNVFYSFHYQDVLRVNQVRNSGKIRSTDKGRQLTPQDRSLWEKVRRTNPRNLRTVIDSGLGGTSVTCVLAGYETWSREWVRYEIARSVMRGNGLLTVHIHGCKCPNAGYSPPGYNPLSSMALGWDDRLWEHRGGQWVHYDKITDKLPAWPTWLQRPDPGFVMPLSAGARAYDWVADDGFNNLIHWTDAAALAAGK